MNKEKVLEILNKQIEVKDEYNGNDDEVSIAEFLVNQEIMGWKASKEAIINDVKVTVAQNKGESNFSGYGESTITIYRIEAEGIETFWKINGYYSSDCGHELELENTWQVVPTEKTIIVYEPITSV